MKIIKASAAVDSDELSGADEFSGLADGFFRTKWESPSVFNLPFDGYDPDYDGIQGADDVSSVHMVREGDARVFHVNRAGAEPGYCATIDIFIDAEYAFGDGRHPTTGICIEFLGRHLCSISADNRGSISMVDVGTGSGILSIMALKSGVGRVDAIDLSPAAVMSAMANSRLNGCDFMIQHCDVAEFDPGVAYDIVAANVVTPVFAAHMPSILRLLKHGGIVIASGINISSADAARDCFKEHGLVIIDFIVWKGWMGFLLQRSC